MKAPREKPVSLDMPFDEALTRFIGTAPAELPADVHPKGKSQRSGGPPDKNESKASL